VSTYNHNQVNLRDGHGAAPVLVAGPGAMGTITSVTCTALPDIRDTVQVWDGPFIVAAFTFWKSDDAIKVNVAQNIAKPYREPRGLQFKVISDGGKTGAYTLTFT
jgi:hypothetical protein